MRTASPTPRTFSGLLTPVALAAGVLLTVLAIPEPAPADAAASNTVRPGQSIQAAIDRAGAGGTIHVKPGTYREQLLITKDRVRIEADGAKLVAPSTLTPNACTGVAHVGPPDPAGPPADAGICIVGDVDFGPFDMFLTHRPVTTTRRSVTGVTVSGLDISGFAVAVVIAGGERTTIEETRVGGVDPYGILAVSSPKTMLRSNTITNPAGAIAGIAACVENSPGSSLSENTTSGFVVGLCISSSQISVRSNRVRGNHFGIYTDPGMRDIVIRDNTVTDNTRVDGFPLPTGIGIIVDGSSQVTIANNRITGNVGDNKDMGMGAGGIVVIDNAQFSKPATDITIRNNSIDGNGDGTTSADLWFDNAASNVVKGNKCKTSHPVGLC